MESLKTESWGFNVARVESKSQESKRKLIAQSSNIGKKRNLLMINVVIFDVVLMMMVDVVLMMMF
ncbi:hypothetical protein HYC85_000350 [Camellia sinensis]|uniref:Transmembrane protein n=1 Tax=Camellia sinensis TaxID=4442 RepID=A0A7J7I3L3_CAMSI|nr:hypothetical protein HYC85_000350 [Camellia sinensis]